MDDHIMVSVKFRGHCKLVYVHQSTSWCEYSGALSMKWGELVGKKLSCTCSVTSLTAVSLERDDDLNNLLLVYKMAKVCTVNVLLDCDQPPVVYPSEFVHPMDVISSSLCGRQSSDERTEHDSVEPHKNMLITNGRSIVFTGKSLLPTYDVCPAVKRKPMLSDGWSDLMKKGVGQVFRGGDVEFRVELIKYSAQTGFKFVYKRNNFRYIHAVCNESKFKL